MIHVHDRCAGSLSTILLNCHPRISFARCSGRGTRMRRSISSPLGLPRRLSGRWSRRRLRRASRRTTTSPSHTSTKQAWRMYSLPFSLAKLVVVDDSGRLSSFPFFRNVWTASASLFRSHMRLRSRRVYVNTHPTRGQIPERSRYVYSPRCCCWELWCTHGGECPSLCEASGVGRAGVQGAAARCVAWGDVRCGGRVMLCSKRPGDTRAAMGQ